MELLRPIWDCVKYLCVQLKPRIDYIKNIAENFEELKEKAANLNTRKMDINEDINKNIVLKKPSAECEDWLNKAQEIEDQVKELEAEFHENKRCISRCCPNIWSRFKLGKHIVTMTLKIAKMIEASEFKGGVVVDVPPQIVEQIPAIVIQGNTSSDRTIQKILRCINDENTHKIGVWGMGGVGKTTLMKALNNLSKITQMFQIVIWVTVSKDWSSRNVQKQVARRLKLDFSNNEFDQEIASILHQKLETMKYLLLLDDVWDQVDLEAIGVPRPTKENGCKIVLSTRSLLVCKRMFTDEDIKVEVLSTEEAWDLFHNKVGDVVDHRNIRTLARDVVEECGGLPLAIIVIAGSLRKESDVHVWRSTLRELKKATFELHGMEESLFMQLKVSYDRLKDSNTKNCFLYCSLYPEDFKIDAVELIEYWWAESLIDGVQNLDEAYDKGHTIVNDLTNASLLEIEGDDHNLVVKMHDVIRDLAIRITSPNNGEDTSYKFLVKAQTGLKEPPNEEEWRQVQRTSLMYNNLIRLPERPECTSLLTLFLQGNWYLNTIPTSFFVQMPSLRVLNLSDTNITRLPMQVGHLKRLEMLHLQSESWGIVDLPSEVGELTLLKSLRVSFNSTSLNVVKIPKGVLAKLSLLEDLRINVTRSGSEKSCLYKIATTTKEVTSLNYLNHLEFPFVQKGDLEHFLQRSCAWKDKRLKSFNFLVGDNLVYPTSYKHHGGKQYFKLAADNNVPNITTVEEVLDRCCAFTLSHHKTIKKLSDIGNMENMKGLKVCLIISCEAIETIVDVNGSSSSLPFHDILPDLENLTLRELPKLRTIWKGLMPPQSLISLRYLHLESCPKLTNVFSCGMIQRLVNLEELLIIHCEEVREIVNEEEEKNMVVNNKEGKAVPVVLFPKLKTLELVVLPNLVRICKGISNPMGWPSLNKLRITYCDRLKKFPLSIRNAPALTAIKGNDLQWFESLEWEDNNGDNFTKEKLPFLFKGLEG